MAANTKTNGIVSLVIAFADGIRASVFASKLPAFSFPVVSRSRLF